jgi:pyridoxamine 5'-phosphate oxidase
MRYHKTRTATMTDFLPDTAPGFDQPIAVLKHCHERIRKQLATLGKLLEHLPAHGADQQARQAAHAVIKYFDKAAHLHHEDEEQNLLPMLRGVAQGADAAVLAELAPQILADHSAMDALWQDLHEQLKGIEAGTAVVSPELVGNFVDSYTRHMVTEETQVAPMAMRLFSPAQMAELGAAMQARRGIVAAPTGDSVAQLRTDYGQHSLSESDVSPDPFAQFAKWFDEALAAQAREPNAMGLSTVDAHGKPSSRIVLVKQFDPRGFTWYTNYDSHKGGELRTNPYAALLFFWAELERQVRIEGKVERTSAEESDTYFHSRPLKSRLAAIASVQSAPIADRAALEHNYEVVAARYGDNPPRPQHWGGFRLVPERIEFWQGRRSRFHDRIVYVKQADGSWLRERLQP